MTYDGRMISLAITTQTADGAAGAWETCGNACRRARALVIGGVTYVTR